MMKAKQKTAYWTHKTHLFQPDEFICSNCGNSFDKAYRICPACDSLMTKEKYDASWVDEAEIMDIILGD